MKKQFIAAVALTVSLGFGAGNILADEARATTNLQGSVPGIYTIEVNEGSDALTGAMCRPQSALMIREYC